MLPMTRDEFENVAEQALETLPEQFSKHIENVEIMVEDYPSDEVQQSMRVSRRGLLGLYTGTPLNKRGATYPPLFPDRIYLYQKNIEAVCRSRGELIEQIQKTVLHEIGHYFGIDDKRLRELGF
jgi:predicted Zn-dependent protease with MMP-like domain